MAQRVELRNFQPSDAAWVIARHAAHYAADEGYDSSFEALVAQIVAEFLHAQNAAREAGWIAWAADQPLGSIFCVQDPEAGPEVAKLRLFLVEPQARGSGLAQHMLETCIAFARSAGYQQMRLWTHQSHLAAGRIYRRNGFDLVEETAAEAFGQPVIDQIWQRDL